MSDIHNYTPIGEEATVSKTRVSVSLQYSAKYIISADSSVWVRVPCDDDTRDRASTVSTVAIVRQPVWVVAYHLYH